MPLAFSLPVLVPYALRAPAPFNLGVKYLWHGFPTSHSSQLIASVLVARAYLRASGTARCRAAAVPPAVHASRSVHFRCVCGTRCIRRRELPLLHGAVSAWSLQCVADSAMATAAVVAWHRSFG